MTFIAKRLVRKKNGTCVYDSMQLAKDKRYKEYSVAIQAIRARPKESFF
jgi:hypothetical protein